MRIAMVGTRGVPAQYGGFETAVEEIGQRLVESGHEVTVYCRRPPSGGSPVPPVYLGMKTVTLPAIRSKMLETISHAALSSLHLAANPNYDAVFLFNASNSPLLPIFRLRGQRCSVHVDGLEWERAKWNRAGRLAHRWGESLAVRWADELIADADGIADYYDAEFGASTAKIAYGAPILGELGDDLLAPLGVTRGEFHLVVARFEPENNLDMIVSGYRQSDAKFPLLVVGSSPYGHQYSEQVYRAAHGDERIRFLGSVWDQQQLDQLYQHALTYLHGHSVGGTNPSLLRAMGAGTAVVAFDVRFNRGVAGTNATYFSDVSEVAQLIEAAESDPLATLQRGSRLRDRAAATYDWDQVAEAYAQLAESLASGRSRRGEATGRRRRPEP